MEARDSVNSVRDVGIIFEPNVKFGKHITSVVAQGNCVAG